MRRVRKLCFNSFVISIIIALIFLFKWINWSDSVSDFKNGERFETESSKLNESSSQLNEFNSKVNESSSEWKQYKTILVYNFPSWWVVTPGTKAFKELKCSVKTCKITTHVSERQTADLVLFHGPYVDTNYTRSPKQIYALYSLESPPHSAGIEVPNIINWTITYRYDSTIPAPYAKWLNFDPKVKQKEQNRNYALNKTKMVAWFVSNCFTANQRLEYAQELQKYIQVDIYGACGNCTCPRESEKECFDILDKEYKFYLSFENSNCKDYITEKFFENALQRNILPIVMGAPQEDYEKYAPQRSYIHVDEFKSPKELAHYLQVLDGSDEMYNSYFQWKGTGEVVMATAASFLCDICAMLHDNRNISIPKWLEDVNEWWRGPGICTS